MAFHEAGHALGRYITAAEMGYSPQESVFGIVCEGLSQEGADRPIFPASVPEPAVQATTFGPLLSREMQDLLFREYGNRQEFSKPFIAEFFAGLRADGRSPDTGDWLRARALIAVMGAISEALAAATEHGETTMKQVAERALALLNSDACDGDVETFTEDCAIAGDARPDTVRQYLTDAFSRGLQLLQRSEIHGALTLIAALVMRKGGASGEEVVQILNARLARR